MLGRSREIPALVGNLPLLIGASRKGFIGAVTGEKDAKERDFGSVAANLKAMEGGAPGKMIVRVHNVRGMKQAADVFDAIGEWEKRGEEGKEEKGGEQEKEVVEIEEEKKGEEKEEKEERTKKAAPDVSARRPTKVCDPYENRGKPLSQAQCAPLLGTVSKEWSLETEQGSAPADGDGAFPAALVREIEVESFMDGSKLVTTLAATAFNNGHYPEILLERRLGKKKWQEVVVVRCSTKVVRGLSFQDFLLATMMDTEIERR